MKLVDSKEINIANENSIEILKDYLKFAASQGHEGLLVKSLDEKTFYDPNGRT